MSLVSAASATPPASEARESYARDLKVFLVLMLFAIMLTPRLAVTAAAPKVRLEEFLILALFAYILVQALGSRQVKFAWGMRQTMLLAFPLCLFISIGSGLFLGFEAGLGDLNQLIRIVKYLIIYTVAVSVVTLSPDAEQARTSIINWILIFACLLTLVTTQQYFNLFNLNSLYIHRIADEWEYQKMLLFGLQRPLGMVGNPNELGFMLAASAIASMYRLLLQFRIFYVVALVLILIAILMTGSRSSLAACLAGFLFVGSMLAFSRMPQKIRFSFRAAAVLGVAVLLVSAGGLTDVYGDMLERFQGLMAPEDDLSWQMRLKRWHENIELFQESPAFGVGPLRYTTVMEAAADNEWLLLLRTYGVFGTLYLILIFVLPHFFAPWHRSALLAFSLYASCALYMIPSAVFHSLGLMPLVLILIALSDTGARAKVIR